MVLFFKENLHVKRFAKDALKFKQNIQKPDFGDWLSELPKPSRSVVLNVVRMAAHIILMWTFFWPTMYFLNIYYAYFRPLNELKLPHFNCCFWLFL